MKIDNQTQANAVSRWIERINKHVIELNKMERRQSMIIDDPVTVALRLKNYLEASLINYSEEQNYGNQTTEEAPEKSTRGILQQDSGESVPEGDYTPDEGTEFGEKETEVADDLPSEDSRPEWEAP